MRQLEEPSERRKIPKQPYQLTRSKTTPYDKSTCFFCEEPAKEKQPLHLVSTFSAGQSLSEAIKISGNDVLRVKQSAAVSANDAHALDIKYHKNCWLKNVSNVLRHKQSSTVESRIQLVSEAAARIEFVAITETALRERQLLTMSEVQSMMRDALAGNEAAKATYSRKALKALLESEIPDIEYHKPKRRNEPERVSVKETRDEAIQLAETIKVDCNKEMKTLFDAAMYLRNAINKSKRWEFTGTLGDADDAVPEELYLFSRWLIHGSKRNKLSTKKLEDVKRRAMSLSQTVMTMCLTERQTNNRKSETLRLAREMPQQLAVGLAVHQATRSKQLVNMLHGFGMSLEYNRLMRVEAQIEASVLQQIVETGGVYIPPNIVKGRYIYFAVDNVDFSEDTYDGKRTLHAAAMAIYQKKEEEDEVRELR